MSIAKCLLIYINVSVSIMSSVLSTCGHDYRLFKLFVDAWLLYTFHVYFLYHLTWCRAFIRKSCREIMPTGGNSRTCQILLQLLSSAGQNNSNVKILPDLTKMSKLTENLYPIFCSQISIKHFCTKFIILLSLVEDNFTLSNAKSLCFTICLMTDNFIC